MIKYIAIFLLLTSCIRSSKNPNVLTIDVDHIIREWDLDSFNDVSYDSISFWFNNSDYELYPDVFSKVLVNSDTLGIIFLLSTDDLDGVFLKHKSRRMPYLLSGGYCNGPEEIDSDTIKWCDRKIAQWLNDKKKYMVTTYERYSSGDDAEKIFEKEKSIIFYPLMARETREKR